MRIIPFFGGATISLWVIFSLWVGRTSGALIHWRDLVGSVVLTLGSAALGWWLAGRATRDPDRRGLVALIFGIWAPLTASVQVGLTVYVHGAFRSDLLSTGLWTFWCALAVWLVLRTRAPLAGATRAVAIAALALVVLQAGELVRTLRASSDSPASLRSEVVASTSSPSVYLLVLDKFSSPSWMAHTYGVDLSAFTDSLRALGFVVPRAAHANYSHTHLSLSSFLNWRHLDLAEDAEGGLPWGRTRGLIRESRTWSAFSARGYRIFSFPSWFNATNEIEGAQRLGRYLSPTPASWGEAWIVNSPFARLFERRCRASTCKAAGVSPYPIESLEEIEWKLSTFASLPDSAGPTLAFLHLLLPHEPYLFEDDCSLGTPWWPQTDQPPSFDGIGLAYAAQVRCSAPLILRTVRTLLERSKQPPVILIQSDHGHGRVFTDLLKGLTLSADELTDEQLGERMSVFAAYYLPGGEDQLYDEISAVNVFRAVARVLWNDTTPPLPDRVWYSAYQTGFDMTEVPAAMTRPPAVP